MKNLIQRFIREEEGQDIIEYALLAAFISIAAIAAIVADRPQGQRLLHQCQQRS